MAPSSIRPRTDSQNPNPYHETVTLRTLPTALLFNYFIVYTLPVLYGTFLFLFLCTPVLYKKAQVAAGMFAARVHFMPHDAGLRSMAA